VATAIERENLEAHVELCAERYRLLETKLDTLEERLVGLHKVMGDLTLRGVTKPVEFDLEFGGFATDPYGNYKLAATVTGEINREDFGLVWNAALETGGVLVGEKVTITIELQAALQV
jgi:polyisoprenoid-binding protein YceI